MRHASALPTASSLLVKLREHCGTQSTLTVMWILDTWVSPPVSENSISVDSSTHTVTCLCEWTRDKHILKMNPCRSTSSEHILSALALEELKDKCTNLLSFLQASGNIWHISEKTGSQFCYRQNTSSDAHMWQCLTCLSPVWYWPTELNRFWSLTEASVYILLHLTNYC